MLIKTAVYPNGLLSQSLVLQILGPGGALKSAPSNFLTTTLHYTKPQHVQA